VGSAVSFPAGYGAQSQSQTQFRYILSRRIVTDGSDCGFFVRTKILKRIYRLHFPGKASAPFPCPCMPAAPTCNTAWFVASVAASGCADGSTEGLQSGQHDRVAACDGQWSGHVENSSSLCAAGWTVCGWDTLDLLRTVNRDDVMTLSGCYALNAAQRHDAQCRPCYDAVTTLLVDFYLLQD